MRRWFIFLMLMFTVSAAQARPPTMEQRLSDGIRAFYATDWVRADSTFNALMKSHPADARAYFFSSMIPFWTYFFGGNQPVHAATFLKSSEKAIEVAEKRLSAAPSDTSTVLLLSGLHGYRSLVAASEKEYRVAIGSGIKGYGFTKQLMAYGEEYPNALMGQGVFQYMIGTIPGEVRWMASLAGLSGDKNVGLRQLARVAASDSHAKHDAIMIMAFLMERERRTEEAMAYHRQMLKSFPENVFATYHLSRLLESKGRVQEARAGYLKVMQTRQPEFAFLRMESRKKTGDRTGTVID